MTLPARILWMSGRSDPRHGRLSAEQHALLDALPVPEACKVRANFPFRDEDGEPLEPPPLWWGSLANAVQYAFAGRVVRRHGPRWREQALGVRRVLVVAGSQGLELVRRLQTVAPLPVPLDVLALGPVARGAFTERVTVVVGSHDRMARRWARRVGADFREVEGVGHLDYVSSPEVRGLAVEWCRAHAGDGR